MAPQPTGRSRKRPRRRLRELEREAARRALNGNGMNGSLPPLPVGDAVGDGDEGAADFGTLFGHPYGALPFGNIHLASPQPSSPQTPSIANNDNDGQGTTGAPTSPSPTQWHPDIVRHQGLGPLLRRLNDEQILSILSFVDGPTLAGGVVQASRFLYVAGHHEELWRDVALRRWGESGFAVPPPTEKGNESHFAGDGGDDLSSREGNCGCWKDIYAYNHYLPAHKQPMNLAREARPRLTHEPIPIQGIYSDTLFRSFLCRSFALQPSWLATHTVPTLNHEEVTTERFVKEYEEPNVPLLIKGASHSWPALGGTREGRNKWTKEYLLKVAEGKTFRATSGAAPLPATFSMKDYLSYCASSTEEAPLYLFDRTFAAKCPKLLEDFDGGMMESCPWWARYNAESGHDLFATLGKGRRPDYQWLIVGPQRSGSCFHIDPNCTHAWNAPIIGRKRWIFYPPGATPPGVFPSPSGDDVCMPISIGEWLLTYWDQHVERRNDPDVSRRPLECTACPGDVLFVPHGWWHMVLNIGDDGAGDDRGMSVALTRNYVSASNLPDVLRFLDTRVNQISGCRDREEAVQPEDLGREFRRALLSWETEKGGVASDGGEEKKCDEGSKQKMWAELLKRSEEKAKKGWGCAAWVDLPSSCVEERDISGQSEEAKMQTSSSCSSILARAKQPPPTTEGASLTEGPATPSAAGFSFSFL
ncbi:hypothetical protein ACHAXT_011267 [Thalassiosira profunda]